MYSMCGSSSSQGQSLTCAVAAAVTGEVKSSRVMFVRSEKVGKVQRFVGHSFHYLFESSHNTSTQKRKVIDFFSYRFGLIEIVIASDIYQEWQWLFYSYRSKVTKLLLLFRNTPGFPLSGMKLTVQHTCKRRIKRR